MLRRMTFDIPIPITNTRAMLAASLSRTHQTRRARGEHCCSCRRGRVESSNLAAVAVLDALTELGRLAPVMA